MRLLVNQREIGITTRDIIRSAGQVCPPVILRPFNSFNLAEETVTANTNAGRASG